MVKQISVCAVFVFLMSHEKHDKKQKRLKVMEERSKEPDQGGVTLADIGFKC